MKVDKEKELRKNKTDRSVYYKEKSIKKGDTTREMILRKAASLFNTKGYAACSMADIMEATGLRKGGIYNHFSGKSDIAIGAFHFAVQEVDHMIRSHLEKATTEEARLRAVLDFYRRYASEPIIRGGCPLLNTLVDADDTHPGLKIEALETLARWKGRLVRLIARGQESGEFKLGEDSHTLAEFIFASIEGGIALSRASGNNGPMIAVTGHLEHYLNQCLFRQQ